MPPAADHAADFVIAEREAPPLALLDHGHLKPRQVARLHQLIG